MAKPDRPTMADLPDSSGSKNTITCGTGLPSQITLPLVGAVGKSPPAPHPARSTKYEVLSTKQANVNDLNIVPFRPSYFVLRTFSFSTLPPRGHRLAN